MAVIATFLKCLEETDEIGSDDVYTVAWSAGTSNIVYTTLTSSSDPSLGTSNWGDFDKGEERVGHRLVYPTLAVTGGAVQIAIMEKDHGHDFHATSTETKKLETFLKLKLAITPPAAQAALMPVWFAYGIGKYRTNDEVIGFTTIGHSTTLVTQDLLLTGDGSRYRLKLRSKI